MKTEKFIVLADNDGMIRDTNSVKDVCLNSFCTEVWGNVLGDTYPTDIHRRMHGRPMAEIFVQIAAECYGKSITLAKGQEITNQLNEYIKPEYVSRRVYPGAKNFFRALQAMEIPLYILTSMEEDLVAAGLKKHGMANLFDGILGAPKTKEENIAALMEKYPNHRIIVLGNAMAAYKATMTYPGTIFLAFDFENREKQVFPEGVNVLTSYSDEVWDELISQM